MVVIIFKKFKLGAVKKNYTYQLKFFNDLIPFFLIFYFLFHEKEKNLS